MNCQIIFEKSDRVYIAGDVVKGEIVLTISKRRPIKAIMVHLHGHCYVSWRELFGIPFLKTARTHYTSREEYLNTVTWLAHYDHLAMIESGEYRYGFQYTLSPQLPSSLEANDGYIRYSINVLVHGRWTSATFHKSFRVFAMGVSGPQSIIHTRPMSTTIESHKQGYLCGCKYIPFTVSINIPKTNYMPGEMINIKTNLKFKQSDSVPFSITYSLIQIVTFNGRGRKRKVNSFLKVRDHLETMGNNDILHSLKVPLMPASGSTYLDYMIISYMLKVAVKLQYSLSNVKTKMRLLIEGPQMLKLEQTGHFIDESIFQPGLSAPLESPKSVLNDKITVVESVPKPLNDPGKPINITPALPRAVEVADANVGITNHPAPDLNTEIDYDSNSKGDDPDFVKESNDGRVSPEENEDNNKPMTES